MSRAAIYVVGDKFATFGANDGVVTVSDLLTGIEQGDFAGESGQGTHFRLGQGLHHEQIQMLVAAAESRQILQSFDRKIRDGRDTCAKRGEVHKHRPENVLITSPRRIADDVFESDLVIDDRCELMNDHVTGQHVQGMVLIEAARQMFLAVTEAFFVDPESGHHYYFVINEMNTEFRRFLFPVEAIVRYRIIESDVTDPGRLSFTAAIDVMQADRSTTTVNVRFTAFDAEVIERKEAEKARQTIE
ncbi:MAG TPA: AfsA-related hotdog domain-containing protein, partial [Arenibaculum sp.]|nr:AfsA-related hotdog domain-containing protein [Arenibaculum sp.]